LEGLWLATNRAAYLTLFRYFLRPFAVTFGMGVVSGVVMSYQFGTNWSVFADKTGPVLGPLMTYEVLAAFFLEAGFLGVMLFGMNRVGRGMHWFATLMVAFGTLVSAFWILSVNSWMQTPSGYAVNDAGQFVPDDWLRIVFNPSFPFRFVHMVLAAMLATAFLVAGSAARHLESHVEARTAFAMALWMAIAVAPIQALAGHAHGVNTFEHQPAKIAAIEGHFETTQPAPLVLLGWPDDAEERTHVWLSVPKLGSWILTHDANAQIPGLKEWPRDARPRSLVVFWTFRAMVGIGFAMIAFGAIGFTLRARGRLLSARWFHRVAVAMTPAGVLAILAGWVTTEMGRQPWTVYGVLRTADSVAPIGTPGVAGSLAAFVVVYLIVFGAGVVYLARLLRQPPEPIPEPDEGDAPFTLQRTGALARRESTRGHG
jgi:cytochrome d ubiquinol oxidase subunit I